MSPGRGELPTDRQDELAPTSAADVDTAVPAPHKGQDRALPFAGAYSAGSASAGPGGSPGSGPVTTGSPERDQSLYEPT